MNKSEFLQSLATHLTRLPQSERDEILADYTAYFDDALADGRSEADVAAALGDPQKLARELTAERKLKTWEANKSPRNLWPVLASLGLINLLLLSPYLLVLTVLSSLWLGALSIVLAGVLITGGWASHTAFGWPALNQVVLNDSGIGPLLISGADGSPAQIKVTAGNDEQFSIHTDKDGKTMIEARSGDDVFQLEKDKNGNIAQLKTSDGQGSVQLRGISSPSASSMLVFGLVLLLLGSLGVFLGWKALHAIWRGTGNWLRWQEQLLRTNQAKV